MKLWFVLMPLVLAAIFAAGITFKVMVYNECRQEHSRLYCLQLVSK